MIDDLDGSIIGIKQSTRAVKAGNAKMAYVARDADSFVREPFIDTCRKNNVPVTFVETCKELGTACGIDVGAAVVVIPKVSE